MGSWCCSCFVFGRTKERLNHYPMDNKGELLNVDCLIYFATVCIGVPCVPLWLRRSEIRRKFGIEGNGCTDCVLRHVSVS